MYGISLRLVSVFVALCVVFASGWWINGMRWEKREAERIVKLTEAARNVQNTIHAVYVAERNKKDEEIRSVNKRLADALSGLRDRPSRTAGSVTGIGKASTGAELSREDSQFLIREAARADEVVADRNACYALYESARIALGK